ncbi:MAG: LytTR family DNA-binding domain-containing protein [Ignavibacteriae bacterium]|nr:LytTR family DNA-binding domain-containing protein [Ignavibacteriota bacterium]
MRILIVEDEPLIAEELKELTLQFLKNEIQSMDIVYTITKANEYIKNNKIDLLLLDLNLNGKNGFEILKDVVIENFHTIVISAHSERAIEAFEYGVLDFVPKPINMARISFALNRFLGKTVPNEHKLKYIVIKKNQSHSLIDLKDVQYFESKRYIVEVHLKNEKKYIIDKSLNRLEQLLPLNFLRIHRSYIIDIKELNSYKHIGGGVYNACLKNNIEIVKYNF